MAWLADGAIIVTFLAQALFIDPVSLDPLVNRLPLALGGISICLALSALARPPAVPWDRLDRALAGVVVWAACLAAFSPGPVAATHRWLAVSLGFQAYLLGHLWRARSDRLVLLARLSVAGLVLAQLVLPVEYARPAGLHLDVAVQTGSLVSTLANPDYTAAWLLVAAPVAATGRSPAVWVLVGLIALGWTLSRTAWLAMLVALWLVHRRIARPSSIPGWMVGGALGLVVVGAFLASTQDRAKLLDPATAKKRLALWSASVRIASESPATGHGLGWFEEVYASRRPSDWDLVGLPATTSFAHNLPLQIAVETGLGGLLAVSLLGVELRRSGIGHGGREIPVGIAVGLVAFLVHNLASVSACILPVWLYACLNLGTLAAGRVEKTSSRQARPALVVIAALVVVDLLCLPWALGQNRAMHLAGQAQASLGKGRFAEARKLAEAAVVESPAEPRVRNLLAAALGEDGRSLMAYGNYLMLEAQQPHFGQTGYNKARVLLDLNRPREALVALEAFLAREPRSFEGRYSLAEALFMLGHVERSKAALVRARALAGSDRALLGRLDQLDRELERLPSPVGPR